MTRCPECHHVIEPGDERDRHTSATWSEPAMTLSACVFCTPDEVDPRERGDDDGREYADPRDGDRW